MKFGLRAHDFLIDDDLELLAKTINKNKIEYIQFANGISLPEESNKGTQISKELGKKVQTLLKRNGIQISVLSCYINLIDPDKKLEEKNIKQFQKYLSLAGEYNAKLVGTEPGSVDPFFRPTELNYKKSAVKHTIDNVKKLIEIGKKNNTFVGIEAGVNHPIHSLDTIGQLINEVDSKYLKIILDPVNLLDEKNKDSLYEILETGLERFKDEIYAIHIKDYIFDENKEIVTPGTGIMDFEKALGIIKRHLPNAIVILDEAPREGLEAGIKLLRRKIEIIDNKKRCLL